MGKNHSLAVNFMLALLLDANILSWLAVYFMKCDSRNHFSLPQC